MFDLGKTLRNDAIEEAELGWILSVEIVGRRDKEVESLLCVTAVAKGENVDFEGARQG